MRMCAYCATCSNSSRRVKRKEESWWGRRGSANIEITFLATATSWKSSLTSRQGRIYVFGISFDNTTELKRDRQVAEIFYLWSNVNWIIESGLGGVRRKRERKKVRKRRKFEMWEMLVTQHKNERLNAPHTNNVLLLSLMRGEEMRFFSVFGMWMEQQEPYEEARDKKVNELVEICNNVRRGILAIENGYQLEFQIFPSSFLISTEKALKTFTPLLLPTREF